MRVRPISTSNAALRGSHRDEPKSSKEFPDPYPPSGTRIRRARNYDEISRIPLLDPIIVAAQTLASRTAVSYQ